MIYFKKTLTVLALLIGVSMAAHAQTVTLKAQGITVKEAIARVEKITGYSFVYYSSDINPEKRVNIRANKAPVSAVVSQILKGQDVSYEIKDRNVIIRKNVQETSAAQQVEGKQKVSGKVVDDNGDPIVGATVRATGANTGTITDINGDFSLIVPKGKKISVSYIGFLDVETTPSEKMNIVMKSGTKSLDEVVVVGYGTQNRQAITGAIAKADISKYEVVPSNNVMEMLKGTIAGLNISGTNAAGALGDFTIRGQNSTSGNSPLIVVDGAIFPGSLADIASDDIESFTVLKDASAAAVYGSRSANGVILIQTKRGKSIDGKPVFNVNLSYGISNELKRPKLYDAKGYIQRLLDIRKTNGQEADPNKISLYLEKIEQENYEATPDHKPTISDPYDLFSQNAFEVKSNLSISNSTQNFNYFISTTLTNQHGVVMNDKYKNFVGRINISTNLTKWLTIGTNTFFSFRDYSGATPDMDRVSQTSPYASMKDKDGNYIQYPQTTTSFESPYWTIRTDDLEKYYDLSSVLNVNVKCPWVKGLSYTLTFSNTLRFGRRYYFNDENTHLGITKNGEGDKYHSKNYNNLLDNIIKYNNTFGGKHNVDVTLLYTREHYTYDTTEGYAENFDNTVLGYNKLEDGKIQKVYTGAGDGGDIGWMARGTYTYDNKYSVTGTIRRDGCSSFSKNNKWGTFASGGVNWNITRENFMKKVSFINNLALRLSYGSNGNQSISPYSTLAKVSTDKYLFAGQNNYSITQYISSIALDNLGWEKTTGTNLGLDFSFLHNRLSGSIDAYLTNTTDLLFNLTVPSVSGRTSILSNIGKIRNKGIELSLHSLNIDAKDFKWSSDFAFSLNRNKVVTILGKDNDGDGKEDDLVSSGYFIGRSLGTIYAYRVTDMWQQKDEDDGTIMSGMRPGDYKLQDVDGDGKITTDKDRQFLGNTNPNFRWSLTNTFKYKEFSLMVYINSVWGGDGYFLSGADTPYNDGYVNNPNINHYVYDYWMPDNSGAKYPRTDYSKNAAYKGIKYYDRSFIKLQKVALSYDLSKYVRPWGINNANVILSADNLLTYAPHWDGLDPETNQGLTETARPSIRTYLMTLSFNF